MMPRAVVQEGQPEAAQREGEGQQAPCFRVVRAACLACLPYSTLHTSVPHGISLRLVEFSASCRA